MRSAALPPAPKGTRVDRPQLNADLFLLCNCHTPCGSVGVRVSELPNEAAMDDKIQQWSSLKEI